jgi:hypothetical protein
MKLDSGSHLYRDKKKNRFMDESLMDVQLDMSSYSTTIKMHLLSQVIYSCKTLYMF